MTATTTRLRTLLFWFAQKHSGDHIFQEGADSHIELTIADSEWLAMDEPNVLTITIEPGDHLNDQ